MCVCVCLFQKEIEERQGVKEGEIEIEMKQTKSLFHILQRCKEFWVDGRISQQRDERTYCKL